MRNMLPASKPGNVSSIGQGLWPDPGYQLSTPVRGALLSVLRPGCPGCCTLSPSGVPLCGSGLRELNLMTRGLPGMQDRKSSLEVAGMVCPGRPCSLPGMQDCDRSSLRSLRWREPEPDAATRPRRLQPG